MALVATVASAGDVVICKVYDDEIDDVTESSVYTNVKAVRDATAEAAIPSVKADAMTNWKVTWIVSSHG